MTTKRKHINKSKVNYFDLGGDWKAMTGSQLGGAIAGAVGGVSGLLGLGINNLNVPTTQNQKITALTNELLMSLMLNYKPIEFLKANVAGLALSGVASGASAGMAFGPWGAAIGGVLGGLSGGITSAIGNDKKKEQEQLLKSQLMRAFSTQANTIGLNQFNNALALSLAKGGYLFDQGGNLYSNLPNQATHGGEFGNGGIEINAGGTHELNPMGGVQMGVGLNGKPNLVEEGEFKFKDYIFSNRLKLDSKNSFADMAKKESKESSERPNDPISKNGLNVAMGKLLKAQEMLKEAQGVKDSNSFWGGGPFDVLTSKENLTALGQLNQLGLTKGATGLGQNNLLRYAPIAASGLASLTDALGVTNTPDYEAVQDLLGLDLLGVKGSKLSDFVNYKPLDTNYLTNQLGANAAGTRAALRGASGGNRAAYMAGLLGADASYNQGLGQLGRQAAEYNQALKMLAAEFNRGTNQFNAQLSNWELGINTQMKADSIKTKAQLKAAARQESRGTKMQNLNTFIEGLGDLGRERNDMAERKQMIKEGIFGGMSADRLSMAGFSKTQIAEELKRRGLTPAEIAKMGYAYGGKLSTKKKGYTY